MITTNYSASRKPFEGPQGQTINQEVLLELEKIGTKYPSIDEKITNAPAHFSAVYVLKGNYQVIIQYIAEIKKESGLQMETISVDKPSLKTPERIENILLKYDFIFVDEKDDAPPMGLV